MIDAERRLVLTYMPTPEAGAAIAALLALDDKLAETLRTTSEPMLGQIRLQWWADALARLDTAPPPPEPVLQGIARDVLRDGVTGTQVAAMVEGWQVLLQADLDAAALAQHGQRGRVLFETVARVTASAAGDPVAAAGEGWALTDLASKLSDPQEAAAARGAAEVALAQACAVRWSRNGRALGAMAHLARMDLAGIAPGSPQRMLRALWHRMTGR